MTMASLKAIRKVLADGTVRVYYRNRETGEMLGTDRAIAESRIAERRQPPPARPLGMTLDFLIVQYLRSASFSHRLDGAPKAAGTARAYRIYAEQLREKLGATPVDRINRAWVADFKTKLHGLPGSGNMLLTVLRSVFKFAVNAELVAIDPTIRAGKVKTERRDAVWSPADIDAFLKAADRPAMRLAFMLMLYTAQRPGDVLAMRRQDVIEHKGRLYIGVAQQKTGVEVTIPVHAELAPYLRERLDDERGDVLVYSPTGKAWNYFNFARDWMATLRRAGLAELQRRDLRRTAVVRMAEAGVSIPRIVAITGHDIDTTTEIIKHYLPRKMDVALAGIEAWESAKAQPRDNVVAFPVKRRRA